MGIQGDGPAELGDGGVVVALMKMDQTAIVKRHHEGRIALDGGLVIGQRLLPLASIEIDVATFLVGQRRLGSELNGPVAIGQRMGQVFVAAVSLGPTAVGQGVTRIEFDGSGKLDDRLLVFVPFQVGAPHLEMQGGGTEIVVGLRLAGEKALELGRGYPMRQAAFPDPIGGPQPTLAGQPPQPPPRDRPLLSAVPLVKPLLAHVYLPRSSPSREDIMPVEPLAIGVCSWSLQVKNVPELKRLLDRLGVDATQIACGDPHHASWDEGDALPAAVRQAGFRLTGAMLGFPGEDYSTPQTIRKTGGFGDPATRPQRLQRLQWALDRTRDLGLTDLMLHGGFLPEPGDPDRPAFLDTLAQASDLARTKGVILALETGQETADLLRRTLDELKCPHLKVNFDPANMLLYEKGDPIRAVEILAPDIRSVHVKDAIRTKVPGTWGDEVPLGQGEVNIRQFLRTLKRVGYRGPLCIEREVGDQEQRVADIADGIRYLKQCLAE